MGEKKRLAMKTQLSGSLLKKSLLLIVPSLMERLFLKVENLSYNTTIKVSPPQADGVSEELALLAHSRDRAAIGPALAPRLDTEKYYFSSILALRR